jgi:hypothetical protein
LSTAGDLVQLLDEVVGSGPSPLTDDSRALARSLMENVDPAQAWGVSAGVPDGWTVALKNGWWLTGPQDIGPAGLWRINTVGMVWDGGGRPRWSIAVLGNEWASYDAGVAAVESISAQVAATLSAEPLSTQLDAPAPAPLPVGAAGGLVTIPPTRVLDTRVSGGPVAPGSTTVVALAGTLPPGATTAVLHLTATDTTSPGFVTAYQCGTALPLASNLDDGPGAPSSDDAFAPVVGSNICVFSSTTTDLVVDVSGGIVPGAGTHLTPSTVPERLVDTRTVSPAVAAGSVTRVPLPTTAGTPSAVLVNVTATGATAAGYVTAFACGAAVPATSTLDYQPGVDTAAGAVVPVADDSICVLASAPVGIVVDLLGTFSSGAAGLRYQSASALRLLDTRDGTGGWLGPDDVEQVLTVRTGLPATAVAIGTVTAVDAQTNGYVTLWSGGGPAPLASVLNYGVGAIVANLTAVDVAGGGAIAAVTNAGTANLVFDLDGWFGP